LFSRQGHATNQIALFRLACDNGLVRHGSADVQTQPTFLVLRAVALETGALQHRIDLAREIDSIRTKRQHEDSDEGRAKHLPVT